MAEMERAEWVLGSTPNLTSSGMIWCVNRTQQWSAPMVAQVRLCVPRNRNWEQHIDPESRSAARYLLHCVNYRRLTRHADSNGLVALKSQYLQNVIDSSVLPAVRQGLIDAGTIECRNDYVPGVRSMRYRITGPYQDSTIRFSNDPVLVRRVRRLREREDRALLPVHRWLKDNLTRLTIDVNRASSIISGMQPQSDCPLDRLEYQQLHTDQVAMFADEISTDDVSLNVDRYGRVHTPLTRFARSLRCCLSTQGEPLVAIDLVNSQPMFAGIVAKQYVTTTKQQRLKLRQWQPLKVPYGRQKQARGALPSITIEEFPEAVGRSGTYESCLRGPRDLQEYLVPQVVSGGS